MVRGGVPRVTGTYYMAAGPIYAVDLSGGGRHLMVWLRSGSHRMVLVRPYPAERVGSEDDTLGRIISQTLRRLRM